MHQEAEDSVVMDDMPSETVKFQAVDQMEETLDNEGFSSRLDQLILNFRAETMGEFIRTKGRLNQQKEQTCDAERRRCNALLGAK